MDASKACMRAKSKATRPTTGRLGPSRLAGGRKSQRRRRLMGPKRTGYATRLRTRRWIRLFVFVPYVYERAHVLWRTTTGREERSHMLAQALSPRGTGTTRRLGGREASGTDTTGRVGTAWAASVRGRGRVPHPAPRWSRPPFCYWRAAWPVARVRARTGTRSGGNWLALLLRCPCACT